MEPRANKTRVTQRNVDHMIKRIVLKISGEALGSRGVDADYVLPLIQNIKALHAQGLDILLVLGAGNLLRGHQARSAWPRHQADALGMLGTVFNGMAMRLMLEESHVPTTLLSAMPMECVESYTVEKVKQAWIKKNIVISAGGINQPFFSTDTGAVLRGIENDVCEVWKGTQVKGVYSQDPHVHSDAKFIPFALHSQAIQNQYGIMDETALILAKKYAMPLRIFSRHDSFVNILEGKQTFSYIGEKDVSRVIH